MEKLGVTVSVTSAYHPQANSQTERMNQEIGCDLRTYCLDNQNDWVRFLPWVEYGQNSLRNSSTNLTPFQCVLGFQPALYPWNPTTSNIQAVDSWFKRSEQVWEQAHQQLLSSKERYRKQADRTRGKTPLLKTGERVWLSTRDIRNLQGNHKLNARYIGPYKIIKQVNSLTYKLLLPRHLRIHPTFHVSWLKRFVPGPLDEVETIQQPPEPLVIQEQPAYIVHKILKSHRQRRGDSVSHRLGRIRPRGAKLGFGKGCPRLSP